MSAPVDYWSCFTCKTVVPRMDPEAAKLCTTCGTSRGELLTNEHFQKGFDHGTYFNIDLKTGGRAKPKRKR